MTYYRRGDFKIGVFVERENRFVVYLEYSGGRLRCHLPNPGRMVYLLIENKTTLIFELVPPNSNRNTDGTVIGIKNGEEVINLDTMLFSDLLPVEIEQNSLDRFHTWNIITSEKTIGKHRFDFILSIDGQKVICEVKSTTRVVDGIACFPDAVSKRASSHLKTLQQLSNEGSSCLVIFTVYQKADSFRPCLTIDPTFADIFYEVLDDIDLLILQIKGTWVDSSTIRYDLTGTLPILKQS